MKWDNIEALLQKYYEGETTLAEEDHLRDFFQKTKLLPENLRQYSGLFQQHTQRDKHLNKALSDDWLFEKIENQAHSQGKQFFFPLQQLSVYWRVAAGILLLVGAFWAGIQFKQNNTTVPNTEVAALRQEVKEIKAALNASSSASERISLVSQEFNADPNNDLLKVLIRTMNTDPNVNVRLAASEALYQYSNNAAVRSAFVESLTIQTDPLVQIALIDILIALKEKSALQQLKALSQQKGLLPIVKSKAEEGIGILI
ncbi:HEAT repeat domain-containing protein [Pontibacter harenae]|uniref:HEAT repeat domain-containing protein n=1 Tax=Pontibacter harenae TaxID=2894083 RepID=UPI001E4C5B58|nr:HEAT repeat domain-containing protein [Pontibacter harenae]MCC9167997.1 HEAT repeat domain-containing protein [Pontibacter harenae]